METILKLEIIDYIFRKIITLNEVNILESPMIKNKSRKIARKKPLSCFEMSLGEMTEKVMEVS